MIAAFTLNLSLDRRYRVENAKVGAVNRAKECIFTAGGKGLNVARIIHAMGGQVVEGGFSGGNIGRCVEELMDAEGLPHRFTPAKNETRCCVNVMDTATGVQTEYLEPGLPIAPEEYQAFLKDFDDICASCSVIILSGSLPAGLPKTTYAELVARAKALGRPVLLDASGEALSAAIAAGPSYIKPNEDEIAALTGEDVEDEEKLIAAAKKLHASGVEHVVISLGARGAMMVCGDGVILGRPPRIHAVNTVGCGDAMTAAFGMAIERGDSAEDAMRFAVAVSAASALNIGTGSVDRADFEMLYPQVTITRK